MNNFMPGTHVRYVGETLFKKFPDEIKRDKIGEVVGRVENSPNARVVEFNGNSYICDINNLVVHVFKEKYEGPEIQKILRRWAVSETD